MVKPYSGYENHEAAGSQKHLYGGYPKDFKFQDSKATFKSLEDVQNFVNNSMHAEKALLT
jgi:hypothetical protein